MVFVTLFTRLKNVHLLKDVGMIPYILHRDHGVDSTVVSFRNEESYPYLDREVKGLKLKFLKRRKGGELYSAARYVWNHAREIDVLNLYHLNLMSFICMGIYRLKKRREGIGYLKLDMDLNGYRRLIRFSPVGWVKRLTILFSDVVSVESTILFDALEKKYHEKVLYIPNGFYSTGKKPELDFHKENIILTVGELGSRPKATENLLDAFAGAAAESDWTLMMVGNVAPEFEPRLKRFMERHEELKGRIVLTGEITDKEELKQIYRRAKIFALPSRSESFGIVLLEAASNGDFLITTKGVPAGYDIYNDGKFGFIVPIDDVPSLSGALVRLINSGTDWDVRAAEIADYTWFNFSWEPIVSKLKAGLDKLRG
ncbi:MAG: glycosyltransferase family 4 protein [Lachnospiraceae bacterium]|nr:glycosyltransferase family 4 protein [Lachnospiraceae bacterium]